LAELREALEVIEVDLDIRVVILTGAGRAFRRDLTWNAALTTPTRMICSPPYGGSI
jgi:enoyl-CoA hydratase/carnithine racemase